MSCIVFLLKRLRNHEGCAQFLDAHYACGILCRFFNIGYYFHEQNLLPPILRRYDSRRSKTVKYFPAHFISIVLATFYFSKSII